MVNVMLLNTIVRHVALIMETVLNLINKIVLNMETAKRRILVGLVTAFATVENMLPKIVDSMEVTVVSVLQMT